MEVIAKLKPLFRFFGTPCTQIMSCLYSEDAQLTKQNWLVKRHFVRAAFGQIIPSTVIQS